jgi:hypothetical protein
VNRIVLTLFVALFGAAPSEAREVARGPGLSEAALAGDRIVWAEGEGAQERILAARGGRRSVLHRLGADGDLFVTDIAGSHALVAYERANIAGNEYKSGSDRREIVVLRAGRTRRLWRCSRFDEGQIELTGVRVAGRRVAFGLGACGSGRVRVATLGRDRRWRTTTYLGSGEHLHLSGDYLGLRGRKDSMRVIDLRTHRIVTRYRGGLIRESALLTDGTLVIAHEYGDGRLRFVAPGARRARAAGAPFYERPLAAGQRVAGNRILRAGERVREHQIVTVTPSGRRTVQTRWKPASRDRGLVDADGRCLLWMRVTPEVAGMAIFARPIRGTPGSPACPG